MEGVMDLDAMSLDGGIARATVRELSRRSDARGLAQLALHASLLTATGVLIAASRGHAWLPAALLVHGVVLTFLFCALHESIHRTAFASRWANDLVASICGALLMLPPEYFRCFHFAHHRFTQDPARDPELVRPGPATFAEYLWRVSGLPYWQERLTVTLRHALTGQVTETFVPPEKRALVVREARALWGCYLGVLALSLYLSPADALLYWVLPAILGQPFLRLFLLAEHTGCALNDDMLVNTRTTATNAAVLLLTWRMPYHGEHHLLPSVPFHALVKVNALLGNRTRTSAPGYLALHRSLVRQFRAAGAATAASATSTANAANPAGTVGATDAAGPSPAESARS
jgi:fatty acid desaturase